MAQYEFQILNGCGGLLSTVKRGTPEELGHAAAMLIDCLRVACIGDDGRRRGLTDEERDALAAALLEHTVVYGVEGRPGWLFVEWPDDPWRLDDEDEQTAVDDRPTKETP